MSWELILSFFTFSSAGRDGTCWNWQLKKSKLYFRPEIWTVNQTRLHSLIVSSCLIYSPIMTITYSNVCIRLFGVWFVFLGERSKHSEGSFTNSNTISTVSCYRLLWCPFQNVFTHKAPSASPSLTHHPPLHLLIRWIPLPLFFPDIQKQHCCLRGVCLQPQCHHTGFQRALQVPGGTRGPPGCPTPTPTRTFR